MLTVTVLHYKSSELTDDCLWWIDNRQTLPPETRKIVIDNGSPIPYKAPSDWDVIRLSENRGNIGGQNACFENSQDGWVLFLANDIRLRTEGCILKLYGLALGLQEFCGQVQPSLLKPGYYTSKNFGVRKALPHWIDNSGLKFKWPGYGLSIKKGLSPLVDAVASSCYIMRKKVWSDIGGFDESLPGAYEDVDIGIRLRRKGFILMHDHHNWAEHLGNSTLKYSKEDKWRFRKARQRVIKKHYKGIDKFLRLSACKVIDFLTSVVQP